MRNNNYLIHYGTKGQKWGIRNYQNADGSYTSKGQSENSGHGRYSKFSYGDKEGFIKKQKRLIKAQFDVYKPSIRKTTDRKNFKNEYKKKYGFDYDYAKAYGARTADKIAKTAHDKNISITKATTNVFLKKAAVDALVAASMYGVAKFAEKNPEEFNKILSTASKTIQKGVNYASYYAKKGVDELKAQLDPNVINVKPKVIPKEVYKLPYNLFQNNTAEYYTVKQNAKSLLSKKDELNDKLYKVYEKYGRYNPDDPNYAEKKRKFHEEFGPVSSELSKVLKEIRNSNYQNLKNKK